jgi:hypothetical protein
VLLEASWNKIDLLNKVVCAAAAAATITEWVAFEAEQLRLDFVGQAVGAG